MLSLLPDYPAFNYRDVNIERYGYWKKQITKFIKKQSSKSI